MLVSGLVSLALALIILVYGIVIYNGLISLKHAVSKHYANIEVLLKQRHDELPKLVATCRQYMSYERATLEQVIRARNLVAEARSAQDMRGLGRAEAHLRKGLGQLFALAEQYPLLKASESFQALQARISDLENAIADRREVYNEAVNNNNVRVEQFPDLLVARLFGFGELDLLEFSEAATRDVNVSALFSGA